MKKMKRRTLWMLETHLDDVSPEFVGYTCDRLMKEGAVDVFTIATNAKKRRCGTLMRIFCAKKDAEKLAAIIMEETSSLGVRAYRCEQYYMDRKVVSVDTAYGKIRVKCAYMHGKLLNAKPEYEDAKKAAEKFKVPLKEVYEKAKKALEKTKVF